MKVEKQGKVYQQMDAVIRTEKYTVIMSLCLITCTLLNIATLVRNSRSKIPARQYYLETNSLFCG